MKLSHNHTIYASYVGYITQAIVNNFAPLLFLTFSRQFRLGLDQIALITTINFSVQLLVDLTSAKLIDRVGYRVSAVAAHLLSAAGLCCLAFLPYRLSYAGILISVVLYAVGGGLIEVMISPIVEACPTEKKEAAMSLLHSFYCWGHVAVILLSTLFFRLFGHRLKDQLRKLPHLLELRRDDGVGDLLVQLVEAIHQRVVFPRGLFRFGGRFRLGGFFRLRLPLFTRGNRLVCLRRFARPSRLFDARSAGRRRPRRFALPVFRFLPEDRVQQHERERGQQAADDEIAQRMQAVAQAVDKPRHTDGIDGDRLPIDAFFLLVFGFRHFGTTFFPCCIILYHPSRGIARFCANGKTDA